MTGLHLLEAQPCHTRRHQQSSIRIGMIEGRLKMRGGGEMNRGWRVVVVDRVDAAIRTSGNYHAMQPGAESLLPPRQHHLQLVH